MSMKSKVLWREIERLNTRLNEKNSDIDALEDELNVVKNNASKNAVAAFHYANCVEQLYNDIRSDFHPNPMGNVVAIVKRLREILEEVREKLHVHP
jgi:predicted RNase H-like nuclease (RuvC/YqgF family)